MKISFSTLGCPRWDMDEICRRGREYGFDGVDFRGYLDTLDITTLPLFTTQVALTRARLAEADLQVSGISSSIKLCEPELRLQNLDEAQRTISVSHALGAKNVRVFGGGDLAKFSRDELAKIASDSLNEILILDGAADLMWLFETHDSWVHSKDSRLLLETVSHPKFGALWDIGNTPHEAGETPEETFKTIGQWIGYAHIKDAVYDPTHPEAMPSGWRYVVPGQGQLPLVDAIRILKSNGYDGWVQFEHEKRWHPEIPEPEEVFPAFVSWINSQLKINSGDRKK